jgi:hypothetical protein
MRARLLVVMKIASQNPPQRRLVPHNDVIQALPANRSDQSFHIWILPRRSRCRDHFFDPRALGERNDCSSENRISIPDQILWRLPWKGFSNLLRRPLFTRVIRYITLKCVTRRRSCDKTMKTNSTRKVAVGTMEKSIEAICFL